MSDYLAADQLDAVRDVAISQSADQAMMRPLLFQQVHHEYVATLPLIPGPALQITSDLMWRAKANLLTLADGPTTAARERARQ